MKRTTEFLTRLKYDDFSSREKPVWLKTTEEFKGYSTVLRDVWTVEKEFWSDGRSSPRLVWSIVPPTGPALWGAVPHDKFYHDAGYTNERGEFVKVSRAKADAVYRELLMAKGFTRFESWVSYAALRAFGWKAWNDHRRRERVEAAMKGVA